MGVLVGHTYNPSHAPRMPYFEAYATVFMFFTSVSKIIHF